MLLSVYGDSIATAYGLRPAQGFVPKLANNFATFSKRYANYINFAQDGMTSWDLASALGYHIDWRAGLREADTICILIGGDDLIQALPLWLTSSSKSAVQRALIYSRQAYFSVISTAVSLQKRQSTMAIGTIYNPFPNTPVAAEAINLYNEQIIVPAAQKFSVPIAPVHAAFAGSEPQLIRGYSNGVAGSSNKHSAQIPIHPNAQGQSVIAGVFADALQFSTHSPKK